ncbi:hypothetical protein HYW19_01005 [Candidatus Woesearchaeota archaeon]|nr:hypothetical protein [Candidatus Woesearchaeota archaeon]
MPAIIVPKRETRVSTPGYVPFIDALQAAYDLHEIEPDGVRWASIDAKLVDMGFPPSVEIEVAKDHPSLAVALYPMVDGKSVTGSDVYHAPMLLRDVQRWGFVREGLGEYSLTGWTGVPEEKEMFQQTRSLTEIIEKLQLAKDIPETTSVVEAVALLPIAPNGEFLTEFAPNVRFGSFGNHSHYRVAVITQDKLSAYVALTEGSRRDIKDMDENQKMYNWKAEFVPDLSDFQKLLLPDSSGHMVLIATPYEKPRPKFDLGDYGFRSRDTLGGDVMRGGPTLSYYGGPTKGMSVGDVSIGRGSEAGSGRLHEGPLESSLTGNPVIYHLRFFGVKPDQARALNGQMLGTLGSSLSNYEHR